MKDKNSFGYWLKNRRQALGLTRDELARKSNCASITVEKIESGERHPSQDVANQLAEVLRIAPEKRGAFLEFARGALPVEPVDFMLGQSNLPERLTPLIGREEDLASIKRRFENDEVRLLTLVGPPGVGKTSLGLQCAKDLRSIFEDGVFLVEFATVSETEGVASAIIRALDLYPSAGETIEQRLRSFLKEKHILLVLDNFEQVVGAAAFIDDLLKNCPTLNVLVTSRVPLNLRAEKRYFVASLEKPDRPMTFAELKEYSAVELFIKRAQSVEPTFELTSENSDAVAKICEYVGGLPLAIELFAARVASFAPQEIVENINGHGLLDTVNLSELPERQRTLRQTVDWSYNLLNEVERHFLLQLSLFSEGWSLDAAQAVCPFQDNRGSHLVLLSTLVSNSLIVRRETEDAPRFFMLEMIREYAHDALIRSPHAAELRQRHREYFFNLARRLGKDIHGRSQVEVMIALNTELGNFRAVLQWCLENDLDMGLRLLWSLGWFWLRASRFIEGREWLEKFLSKDSKDEQARAWAFVILSAVVMPLGDIVKTKESALESQRLGKKVNDAECVAAGMVMEGMGERIAHNYSRAIDLCRHVLKTISDKGSEYNWIRLRALTELGWSAAGLADFASAEKYCKDGLSIARTMGDLRGATLFLGLLGKFAYEAYSYSEALTLLEESIDLCGKIGEKRLLADKLAETADVYYDLGELQEAERLYSESAEINQKIEAIYITSSCAWGLGNIALRKKDFAQAKKIFDEIAPALEKMGNKFVIANFENCYGDLAFAMGDLNQAEFHYRSSLTVYRERIFAQNGVILFQRLAGLANARGENPLALFLLGAYEGIRERHNLIIPPIERADLEKTISDLRAKIAIEDFERCWQEGRSSTDEQAIDRALETEKTRADKTTGQATAYR